MNSSISLDNPIQFEQEREQEYPFSLEEMKQAAESVAECYRRIEKQECKPLAFRE